MDRTLRKRAGVAVTAAALAASVSALFGGVAFAHGWGHNERNYYGGNGSPAGDTWVNCPLPINLNLAILGQAGDDANCNTSGSVASPGAPGAVY